MAEPESHLSDDDQAGLSDVVEIARSNLDRLIHHRREVGRRVAPDLVVPDDQIRSQTEQNLAALEDALAQGDVGAYLAEIRRRSAGLAASGLAFGVIARAMSEVLEPLAAMVDEALAGDHDRAARAHRMLHRLETEFLVVAGEAFAQVREEDVESEYGATVRRLSTPVVEVWDEVLVMPLVGAIDSARAQQMMEQVLERIVEAKARFVLLDITGVPTVDTAVADHLIRTTRAGRLVGARTLLVGIGPMVAQTLVRLGVSLGDIETFVDLRSGLEYALAELGHTITRRPR